MGYRDAARALGPVVPAPLVVRLEELDGLRVSARLQLVDTADVATWSGTAEFRLIHQRDRGTRVLLGTATAAWIGGVGRAELDVAGAEPVSVAGLLGQILPWGATTTAEAPMHAVGDVPGNGGRLELEGAFPGLRLVLLQLVRSDGRPMSSRQVHVVPESSPGRQFLTVDAAGRARILVVDGDSGGLRFLDGRFSSGTVRVASLAPGEIVTLEDGGGRLVVHGWSAGPQQLVAEEQTLGPLDHWPFFPVEGVGPQSVAADLPPGRYRLRQLGRAVGPFEYVLAKGETLHIDLSAPGRGEMQGRTPTPDELVRILAIGEPGTRPAVVAERQSGTAEFRFADLPAGDYLLERFKADELLAWMHVGVPAGEVVDLGLLPTGDASPLRVQVLGPGERPEPGVRLRVSLADVRVSPRVEVITDNEGWAMIPGINPGVGERVRIMGPDWLAFIAIAASSIPKIPLESMSGTGLELSWPDVGLDPPGGAWLLDLRSSQVELWRRLPLLTGSRLRLPDVSGACALFGGSLYLTANAHGTDAGLSRPHRVVVPGAWIPSGAEAIQRVVISAGGHRLSADNTSLTGLVAMDGASAGGQFPIWIGEGWTVRLVFLKGGRTLGSVLASVRNGLLEVSPGG